MKITRVYISVALLAWAATSRAAPVTFSDGVFSNANWTAQKLLNGTFSSFQVASGGNPGEFRETDHLSLNTGQSIFVVNLRTSAVYNPTVSGAISSIDISFDAKFLGGSTGTSQMSFRLAFEQNGSIFVPLTIGTAQGPGNGQPGTTFQSFSFSGFTAADFTKLSGSGSLDFSSSGAPITFGYMTDDTVNLDNAFVKGGIDNWVVTVHPLPIGGNPDDLFEADSGSGIIYKFTPAGTKTTFASGINGAAGGAFDASGNLFVTELNTGTIYKFSRTGTKTTFATGLNGPGGVAFDAAGNLFEGDSTGGTITKITPAGTKTTFASGLNGPGGIAFDSSGNLFEPDQFSGLIYKFAPAGTRTTFASLLQRPIALAFDRAGNLFESDRNSGNVFKFTPVGSKSTFASGLNRPVGLAFDSGGNLFVADQSTGTIYKFTPGGTKTTFATGLSGPEGLAIRPGQLTNISTRLEVLSGNSVLIAGFIISGTDNKEVLLRSLGPTLTQFGVVGALADTTIELHNGAGAIIATNDNWKDTQQAAIMATGKAPPNGLESAILITLAPGSYTLVVRGKNGLTGVALAEVYDLDQTVDATLTNISTRGFVETGVNVMIGGLISSSGNIRILARTLGPTLSQFGVPNVLSDPTLELHDANGALIASNDNWRDTQQATIMSTGKAPPNDLESAIVIMKPAGSGTAIVRGKNNTTGNALLEVYTLPPGP